VRRKVRHEPGGDGVELAHVPEREGPQERAERRRANKRPIPPCRNRPMSSMLSAPAAMPATSETTFAPACAPRSVGTVR
jgi:hypothetical protein